jgi:hypothetical protein
MTDSNVLHVSRHEDRGRSQSRSLSLSVSHCQSLLVIFIFNMFAPNLEVHSLIRERSLMIICGRFS